MSRKDVVVRVRLTEGKEVREKIVVRCGGGEGVGRA